LKSGVKLDGRSTGEVLQERDRITLPMIFIPPFHLPVLLPEVINGLNIRAGGKYIDATIGGGGYTSEIVRRKGIVLGIDLDRDAIDYVKGKVGSNRKIVLAQGSFADLREIADRFKFDKVSGIIFDLGMSTYQLKLAGRGFSFRKDEPLDMRMDKRQKLKAIDIINTYTIRELYEIFAKYAEEFHSLAIAQAIFRTRSLRGPILTTGRLAAVVNQVVKRKKDKEKSLTRIFQALRIIVNNELDNLRKGLSQAIELLEPNGRLAVLSYHSLEDRLVKLKLKEAEKSKIMMNITQNPVRPCWKELRVNPSARSAKLRIAEKI